MIILPTCVFSEPDIIEIKKYNINSFGGIVEKDINDDNIYVSEILMYNLSLYNPGKQKLTGIFINISNPTDEIIYSRVLNKLFEENQSLFLTSYQSDGSWELIYVDSPGTYKLIIYGVIIQANQPKLSITKIMFLENKTFISPKTPIILENTWRKDYSLPIYFDVVSISEKRQNERNKEIADTSNKLTIDIKNLTKWLWIATLILVIIAILQYFNIEKKELGGFFTEFLKYFLYVLAITTVIIFIILIIGYIIALLT